MSESREEFNVQESLTAFSDGELDAAQILQVLNYLATYPDAIEMMRTQQELRLSAYRVITKATPSTPAGLRQRIQLLTDSSTNAADAADAAGDRLAGKGASRQISWAMRSIAAIIVLSMGVIAGRLLLPKASPETPLNEQPAAAVPVTLITAVTRVHVDCSRFAPQLHAGPFPTTAPLGSMSKDVENEFHRNVPYPDLSSIGYSFVGAGPCMKPLQNTVHLLYRSVRPTIRDTLSVFVQPYTGQVKMQPQLMTLIGGTDTAHPAIVWRSQAVVFILVTDDLKTADQARNAMQLAMNQ